MGYMLWGFNRTSRGCYVCVLGGCGVHRRRRRRRRRSISSHDFRLLLGTYEYVWSLTPGSLTPRQPVPVVPTTKMPMGEPPPLYKPELIEPKKRLTILQRCYKEPWVPIGALAPANTPHLSPLVAAHCPALPLPGRRLPDHCRRAVRRLRRLHQRQQGPRAEHDACSRRRAVWHHRRDGRGCQGPLRWGRGQGPRAHKTECGARACEGLSSLATDAPTFLVCHVRMLV